MSEPKPMTPKDAARIQSASDRTGKNADFKGRAQSAGSQHQKQNPAGNQHAGRGGQAGAKK